MKTKLLILGKWLYKLATENKSQDVMVNNSAGSPPVAVYTKYLKKAGYHKLAKVISFAYRHESYLAYMYQHHHSPTVGRLQSRL